MSPEEAGNAIGTLFLFGIFVGLPLWVITEDWRSNIHKNFEDFLKFLEVVDGSIWEAEIYQRNVEDYGWGRIKLMPVTIQSSLSKHYINVRVNETGEEHQINIDKLSRKITDSPRNIKRKNRRNKMPKIFRWALYAALVKLVWMGVNNAPYIAQFIISLFVK